MPLNRSQRNSINNQFAGGWREETVSHRSQPQCISVQGRLSRPARAGARPSSPERITAPWRPGRLQGWAQTGQDEPGDLVIGEKAGHEDWAVSDGEAAMMIKTESSEAPGKVLRANWSSRC